MKFFGEMMVFQYSEQHNGIHGYKNVSVNDSIITFQVIAKPTYVNQVINDLNDARVYIYRNGDEESINIYLKNGTNHSMNIDHKSKVLSISHLSKEAYDYKSFQIDTTAIGLNCVDPICAENFNATGIMLLIIKDPPLIVPMENGVYNIDFESYYGYSGDASNCNKPYYGYTIGWGFTLTTALDHEQSVRNWDITKTNLAKYSCNYLGTDSACGIDGLFCVVVSTFKCCKP